MIDMYASESHFVNHLLPIWDALDESERGSFFARRRVAPLLKAHGIEPVLASPRGDDVLVVASYSGIRDSRTHRGRVVLVEHGVGSTYPGRNPSNPGGEGRERVALYICPSQWVADLNLAAYPDARAAVVGCPRLDVLAKVIERSREARPSRGAHNAENARSNRVSATDEVGVGQPAVTGAGMTSPEPVRPLVPVIAFHWNATLAPESGWAFPHFRSTLQDVAKAFPGAIGHAHPRAFRHLAPSFLDAGLDPVESQEEALSRASVWIQDNSSAMYESAALGVPVVAMNSPRYRREVNFPPRFWSHVPGIQVSEPEDLVGAIERAIQDPPGARALRKRAVSFVYIRVDGKASERAAQAIRLLVDATP